MSGREYQVPVLQLVFVEEFMLAMVNVLCEGMLPVEKVGLFVERFPAMFIPTEIHWFEDE